MRLEDYMKCSLCRGNGRIFFENDNIKYYRCERCSSIFMDPKNYLSVAEEKERYEEHNNDVEDTRYQNFVSDIVENIKEDWDVNAVGLDFGAGTGPVVTKLLKEEGYEVDIYDPFFWNKENHLSKRYDYIVACEVIEHFHNPLNEFELFNSLLKNKGKLYCKTEIYKDNIDFKDWYYKDDPTHVFFYHENSVKWIVEKLGFESYSISDRIIVLNK
jgi:SAM-dependent methyltransferase